MSRRLAREYAIQFLFSFDFNRSEEIENLIEGFFELKSHSIDDEKIEKLSKVDKQFALDIIQGALSKLEEIDGIIKTSTIGWKKERIAKVDLAILRLALYELKNREDIPDSVTANEAIELAKKFSTDESGSFINGVLGKIIRSKTKTDNIKAEIHKE